MSTANLPAYVNPSLHRTPSYAEEPREYEQRIALADRLRPRPSGNFVKQSKGGGASLRLSAQEDDVALPVYGSGGLVEGTVDLSKTESVTSVEVKIEGRLLIKEIAEGGSTSAKLCLNTALLWIKDANNPVCPSSLRFSIPLPHTFTYEDKTFPLPPSFDVKLSGLPGFIATIDYSVSATIAKPHLVPQIRSKKFGIHIGSSIVSTPFIYYPRSRPASAIPAPLVANATGFQPTPSWRVFESSMRSKSTTRDDITTKFYIPTSRMFYMSEPIPFHMTLEASAVSLAAFLPFMPTAHTSGPVKVTRVQLMRQTTVDVRDTVVSGVKTDIWRTDCIGEGTFNLARDGPTSISFSGEIKIADNVKIPGFKAAGLSVKDCILLTVNPIDPGNAPFFDMRQVIPVRLSTDPWTPNGAGIGAHQADAWNRTPSPEDSEPLKRAPTTAPAMSPISQETSMRTDRLVDDSIIDPTTAPTVLPPSHQAPATKVDDMPQQASTQPGDGGHVHTHGHTDTSRASNNPTQHTEKVPFKEQVIGYAQKTRGTLLGKDDLKEHGEMILDGQTTHEQDRA